MSHFDPSWCARLHAAPATPHPLVEAGPASAEATCAYPRLERREVPAVHDCECCGTRMYDHHCKIVCPNCGYKRDCSDP
jgi:hypothetical protein